MICISLQELVNGQERGEGEAAGESDSDTDSDDVHIHLGNIKPAPSYQSVHHITISKTRSYVPCRRRIC